jgi:DNA repair protein RecN (Recombination protein N)
VEEPTNGATLPASEEVRTVVRVVALDDRQRREELAELAGGKSDQEAIAFAESLLVQAANTRLTQSPTAPATKAATKSTRTKTRQSQG